MTRPLIALSNVIIDRIRESDGSDHPPTAGGAGLYAAVAMRMWWPQVALVAGVGADFDAVTGDATARFDLDPRGPVVRAERSIESCLTYFPDGSRSERPTLGKAHFASLDLAADRIDPALLPAAGTYLFRDGSDAHWTESLRRRHALGVLLWEISADFAREGGVDAFRFFCSHVDAVSLNLAEAADLFGAAPPEQLARKIADSGAKLVALRMGAEGALLTQGNDLLHVHPPRHPVVDVTGGGNAFSGGLLAGLCRHPRDLAQAGRCAAAAAACIIAQRGLPPQIDNDLCARLAAATVVTTLSNTAKV